MSSYDHDWRLLHDVDAFLAHAGEFLRSRPALHTVLLTVTEGLRSRGPDAYGSEAPVFGVLERAGEVRAAWFRTPPYNLYVSPLTPDEADSLAARLHAEGHPLPGVSGERDAVAAFADAWRRHTGATPAIRVRQRLYRLGTLTPPKPLPDGRARTADADDRGQLARWYEEFIADTGEVAAKNPAAWADAHIADRRVTLWDTPDGAPASMAAMTPQVAGQIRIGPVYTPPHLRGRGYAGAATSAASALALDRGAAEVLLFTDLSNPTSNGLYQRLGYGAVGDFGVWGF